VTLEQHLAPGPNKKILSLDGGGIRGALTAGYLEKLESIIRDMHDDQAMLLCDYFDLIGGTSTGAIIASLLAIGKTAAEVKELYLSMGGDIFKGKRNWWNPLETFQFLKAEFSEQNIEKALGKFFADITLGDSRIRTGLCIVTKRADTNSVWPLINHPGGKYYPMNKDYFLKDILRASSAAPSYFVPQLLEVDPDTKGAFVDGGVSMANNPSLQLFKVATLKGFPFHWPKGKDKIFVVSLGTGNSLYNLKTTEITNNWITNWASEVPDMLMSDASWENQTIMQWLSYCPNAKEIDREIGDLKDDFIGENDEAILTYLRFNQVIAVKELNDLKIKVSGNDKIFTEQDVSSLKEMSNAGNRFILYDIGAAASKEMEEYKNEFPL
jgi:patatin-like phospholipase/acyl hydrolase